MVTFYSDGHNQYRLVRYMEFIENIEALNILGSYSPQLRDKLLYLRQLIYETAMESKDITLLEETLKWNEPSYVTKKGSTIRINRRKSSPEQYAMYFHCQTRLIETFRELYGELFEYENNRAILFNLSDDIPERELKHCILLSLTYKSRKHLPMLGA